MKAHSFLLAALFAVVTPSLLLAACGKPEPRLGCDSDDDCRFGRVCSNAVCVFPSALGPGARDAGSGDGGQEDPGLEDPGIGDQSPLDLGPDGARRDTDTPDRGEDTPLPDRALIELSPTTLQLGRVPAGSVAQGLVQVFNRGGANLRLEPVDPGRDDIVVELLDSGVVAPGGPPSMLNVTVIAPPRVDGERNINVRIFVPSNAENRDEGYFSVRYRLVPGGADELCLQILEPLEEVSLDAGEVTTVGLEAQNCGTRRLTVDSASIDVEGSEAVTASVDADLPASLRPGDTVPLDVVIAGELPGSAFVTLTAEGLGDDGVPVTAIAQILVEVAGDPCAALDVWAQADRGGPSGNEGFRLPMGHQILISGVDDGSGSYISDFELLASPEGSLDLLGFGDGQLRLVPDLPGVFQLEVEVTSVVGCRLVRTLTFEVSLPDAQLVAWVVWPEGTTRTRDLDFYIARQTDEGYLWETEGQVVGPSHPTADFGVAGSTADDPFLNQDYNTQGFGPELIQIWDLNADERLAVGVHVFFTPNFAPANPRIVIYLDGVRVFGQRLELANDQFWLAAEIEDEALVETYTLVIDGFPDPSLP